MNEAQRAASSHPSPRKRGRRWLFRLGFLGILGGGGWYAWHTYAAPLIAKYVEEIPPKIEFRALPTGMGTGLFRFEMDVSDVGAGLDEVVVRVRQRGASPEVFRKQLSGENQKTFTVEFDRAKFGLEEGPLTLEARAFDRSFFSNAGEASSTLSVDSRRPHVEIVTAQHNIRRGGCQLAVFKAEDQDLAQSGLTIGAVRYLAFPAKILSQELASPENMALFFTLPLEETDPKAKIRLFAEDAVGNISYGKLRYNILPRRQKTLTVKLDTEFPFRLIKILEANKIEPGASTAENVTLYLEHIAPTVEEFIAKAANEGVADEPYTAEAFARINGITQTTFGDQVAWQLGAAPIGGYVETGMEFGLGRDRTVRPVAPGTVRFVGPVPGRGTVVVVTHGLGLATVYSRLGETFSKPGDQVRPTSLLGTLGDSGIGRPNTLHFELRVQGHASDPLEFWDQNWFGPHVSKKIQEAKRTLGLTFEMPDARSTPIKANSLR